MNFTVASGRFIRQVPYFPPWVHDDSYIPPYGYRVLVDERRHNGTVLTYAVANSEDNQENKDLTNEEYIKNLCSTVNGLSAWWNLLKKADNSKKTSADFHLNYLVPWLREQGIHPALELINVWMCSAKTVEKMNEWFYSSGLFEKLKNEDARLERTFPLDELLIPSLSRHFDYQYSFHYNNSQHFYFPQLALPEDRPVTPAIIKKYMDQDKLQSNDYIYFFKKLPGDPKSELYKSFHDNLELL